MSTQPDNANGKRKRAPGGGRKRKYPETLRGFHMLRRTKKTEALLNSIRVRLGGGNDNDILEAGLMRYLADIEAGRERFTDSDLLAVAQAMRKHGGYQDE